MIAWLLLAQTALPTVIVTNDDFVIDKSCIVRVGRTPLPDAGAEGAIHITGSDIVVDFDGGFVKGAADGAAPDGFAGVGILVTGQNVTLKNVRVMGYKCGVLARGANRLTLEKVDASGNFRQRLRSTPEAEDSGDWLWPHKNDAREWVTSYGAGICIEQSDKVTVRNCLVRRGQNGLILDRVNDSRIYDNEFAFLSGWGLALWRSNRNTISRNSLDFCIRGYSHGVYNRGQDSAGLLMFEQCSNNVIAENSATHGGDGLFAFAGRAALGEADSATQPQTQPDSKRRGCNDNLIINNDFSYAAAHGIEITFSFGNQIVGNRLVENAICGVWAGYSQDTLIAANQIIRNGDMAYGLERGGVNIEHGRRNVIRDNHFSENKCGVHLWWDEDAGIAKLPWAQSNEPDAADTLIQGNRFSGEPLALHLRSTKRTTFAGNLLQGVAREMEVTPGSEPIQIEATDDSWTPPAYRAFGARSPTRERMALRGREKIIMTPWGPYDWQGSYLQPLGRGGGAHRFRLLGDFLPQQVDISEGLKVEQTAEGGQARLIVKAPGGGVWPYKLEVETPDGTLTHEDVLVNAVWRVQVFPYEVDPRNDVDAWRRAAQGAAAFELAELTLPFGNGGVSGLASVPGAVREAKLPADRFGTFAETTVNMPAGRWEVQTLSDDGVRVWVDDALVIDNWTWHAPTRDVGAFEVAAPRAVKLRVEHFELDGYAVLELQLRLASRR